MSELQCRHYFIKGKVQGVWFRAFTEQLAKQQQLTGWVRNTDDGRVEVVACGTDEQLTQLELGLHQGPPQAAVTEVIHEAVPWQAFIDFTIK